MATPKVNLRQRKGICYLLILQRMAKDIDRVRELIRKLLSRIPVYLSYLIIEYEQVFGFSSDI
jgi:hypothetical protein